MIHRAPAPQPPLCASFAGRGSEIFQESTAQEVKSIAYYRTGAMTESRDSKGAYTTVVLVSEEDEVTYEEAF